MAITIHIYYTGKNGSAKKFAEEMIAGGIVNQIRALPGNLKYDYYLPMQEEETVLLIDSWADQKALDGYHAAPILQQVLALREKHGLHMRVERYLPDSDIPEQDKKYIRS